MIRPFFLIFAFLLITGPASATPAKDIKLKYDFSTKTLKIELEHVSIKLRDHFIRFIKVSVNNGEPKVFHFVRQDQPSHAEFSLPLDVNSGDVVTVRTMCSEGGNADAEIKIPEHNKDDKDKAVTTQPLEVPQDQSQSEEVPSEQGQYEQGQP